MIKNYAKIITVAESASFERNMSIHTKTTTLGILTRGLEHATNFTPASMKLSLKDSADLSWKMRTMFPCDQCMLTLKCKTDNTYRINLQWLYLTKELKALCIPKYVINAIWESIRDDLAKRKFIKKPIHEEGIDYDASMISHVYKSANMSSMPLP